MVYTANTPQATDYVNATQPVINANFQDIPTYLAINHEPLTGAGGNEGKHKFVQYTLQGTAPGTGITELASYVKNDAAAVPRIYIQQPNSGTEQQLTGNVITNATTPFAGETMLLGGVIIKWGLVTINTTSTTINFSGLPLNLTDFPNNCFGIQLTRNGGTTDGASVSVTAYDKTKFIANSSTVKTFFFIALGN